jgi:hypothetical protein
MTPIKQITPIARNISFNKPKPDHRYAPVNSDQIDLKLPSTLHFSCNVRPRQQCPMPVCPRVTHQHASRTSACIGPCRRTIIRECRGARISFDSQLFPRRVRSLPPLIGGARSQDNPPIRLYKTQSNRFLRRAARSQMERSRYGSNPFASTGSIRPQVKGFRRCVRLWGPCRQRSSGSSQLRSGGLHSETVQTSFVWPSVQSYSIRLIHGKQAIVSLVGSCPR